VDQKVLSLLDEWVRLDAVDEVEQGLLGELGSACRNFSPSVNKELLFRWIMNFTLEVGLLVVGSQMGVCHNKEVSLWV
jgi:hypothetical protein